MLTKKDLFYLTLTTSLGLNLIQGCLDKYQQKRIEFENQIKNQIEKFQPNPDYHPPYIQPEKEIKYLA